MTALNLENQVHLVICWLTPLGKPDPQDGISA